jgi:hypothetical protein
LEKERRRENARLHVICVVPPRRQHTTLDRPLHTHQHHSRATIPSGLGL